MDKGGKWDKGIREANGLREQGRQMRLGNKGNKWDKRGQGDRPGNQGIGDKSSREDNGIMGTSGLLTSLYGGILLLPGNSLPL